LAYNLGEYEQCFVGRDGICWKEPNMINPASFGAATAMAVIIVLTGAADGLAQSKINERASERAIVPPLPPMRVKPGVIVGPIASPIVAPIASPSRSAMPLRPPVPDHPFDHDHDRDRDRDHDNNRGAFAAGVAAGIAVGGALATPGPGVYYVPAPSPANDPVAYCTWMYSSYDPQSGTYIGDDGNPHPCPP
jgi:BA14K-like protein